jgi:hypothetical protein
MKKLILYFIFFAIPLVAYSQSYKDMRGPIRMLYGNDTLIIMFSNDTNYFYGNLEYFKMDGAIIVDSIRFSQSSTWFKSFLNPSTSVDLSDAPDNSILKELNDTIGWFTGLIAQDGKIYSIGINSQSTTGNVIQTNQDTNKIINTYSAGVNLLQASGVGGYNILDAKNTNIFIADDTARVYINSNGIMTIGLKVNGTQVDSIYANADTLYFITDSGAYKMGRELANEFDSTGLSGRIVRDSARIDSIVDALAGLSDILIGSYGIFYDGDTVFIDTTEIATLDSVAQMIHDSLNNATDIRDLLGYGLDAETLIFVDITEIASIDTVNALIAAITPSSSSDTTITLLDNTTGGVINIGQVGYTYFIDYEMIRGSNWRIGRLIVSGYSTTALWIKENYGETATLGVTINSFDVSAGQIRINYTTTSTGSNVTMNLTRTSKL